jgi:hypothetical protein
MRYSTRLQAGEWSSISIWKGALALARSSTGVKRRCAINAVESRNLHVQERNRGGTRFQAGECRTKPRGLQPLRVGFSRRPACLQSPLNQRTRAFSPACALSPSLVTLKVHVAQACHCCPVSESLRTGLRLGVLNALLSRDKNHAATYEPRSRGHAWDGTPPFKGTR